MASVQWGGVNSVALVGALSIFCGYSCNGLFDRLRKTRKGEGLCFWVAMWFVPRWRKGEWEGAGGSKVQPTKTAIFILQKKIIKGKPKENLRSSLCVISS